METEIAVTFNGRYEIDAVQKALAVYADYLQDAGDSLPDLPMYSGWYGNPSANFVDAADRVRKLAQRVQSILIANVN